MGHDGQMADETPAPAPRPRRTPGWVAVLAGFLAFALILIAGGAVVGDWFARNAQMAQLVTAVEASESEMMLVQQRTDAAFADYAAITKPTTQDKLDLNGRLSDIASEGAGAVTRAGDRVAAVRILPWETRIIEARDAYLAHNLAWQEYLSAAALHPIEFTKDQPAVNDTFVAVEPAMRAAVPDPALFDLNKRVDDIFVEPTQDSSSDQSQPNPGDLQPASMLASMLAS